MIKLKLIYITLIDFIRQIKIRSFSKAFKLLIINLRILFSSNPEHLYIKKHKLNQEFLRENITPINIKNDNTEQIENYRIWVLWWQGEEQMPEIVKHTYHSICTYTNKEVILITKDNWKKYINPEIYIEDKVKKGIIKLPALSDYIRASLLYEYGGLWIDSTILITKNIPNFVYESTFFSIHNSNPTTNKYIASGRWNVQVLGTNKRHMDIFRYMIHVFTEYWKNYDYIMDYLLVDYAYNLNYKIKQLIDEVPATNENMHTLRSIINNPFDQEYWDKLNDESNWMFKLTYKDTFVENVNNNITYYKYIKS